MQPVKVEVLDTKELEKQREKEAEITRALLMQPSTFILGMDLDETLIAEAWVLKYLGEAALSRFTNMLDLRALRRESCVIALVRGKGKRGGRSPVLPWVRSEQGERVTEPADTEKLVDEIVVCKPVFAKEHWEDSASRYGGKLKHEAFVSVLGEQITPACPKFTDAAARSAKSGELPSEMVLRWS